MTSPPGLLDTLTERHSVATSSLSASMAERESYEDLLSQISLLEEQGGEPMDTLLDLGSEMYVRARCTKTSHLFVHVGLGFHAELTLEEARNAADVRVAFLRKRERELREEVARLEASADLASTVFGGKSADR